ncbi:hypothetical protein, partial [Acidovorax sp. HMWF018]|uniref:hypothetical protein n=1 Tax=Acidovorax sp. HMWF018 TaxID=2056855 RepID=UPI001E4C0279
LKGPSRATRVASVRARRAARNRNNIVTTFTSSQRAGDLEWLQVRQLARLDYARESRKTDCRPTENCREMGGFDNC